MTASLGIPPNMDIEIFEFSQVSSNAFAQSDSVQMPSWIKGIADFWAQGNLSDQEFADAIEFLIKNKVIQSPEISVLDEAPSDDSQEKKEVVIPEWIKFNARFWADGDITDSDFAEGLKFMIKEELIQSPNIVVGSFAQDDESLPKDEETAPQDADVSDPQDADVSDLLGSDVLGIRGCDEIVLATELKAEGKNNKEIIRQLANELCSSGEIAIALNSVLGLEPEDIIKQLYQGPGFEHSSSEVKWFFSNLDFELEPMFVASFLKENLGYDYYQTSKFLREVYDMDVPNIVNIIDEITRGATYINYIHKDFGYTASEVLQAHQDGVFYGLKTPTISLLKTAHGFNAVDIAKAQKEVRDLGPGKIAYSLSKAAGFSQLEVRRALEEVFPNETDQRIDNALTYAGFSVMTEDELNDIIKRTNSNTYQAFHALVTYNNYDTESVEDMTLAENNLVLNGHPTNEVLAFTQKHLAIKKLAPVLSMVYFYESGHTERVGAGFWGYPRSALDYFMNDLCGLSGGLNPLLLNLLFLSGKLRQQCDKDGEALHWNDPSEISEIYYDDGGNRIPDREFYKLAQNDRVVNYQVSELPPTYYIIDSFGEGQLRISYWWFYGHQANCISFGVIKGGGHRADWEHVDVITNDARTEVKAVTLYQHDGWYTRTADQMEFKSKNPVVYVSRQAHGSFHDSGGSTESIESCLYWGDYRTPDDKNIFWMTGVGTVPGNPNLALVDLNAHLYWDSIPNNASAEDLLAKREALWMIADYNPNKIWEWGYDKVGTTPTRDTFTENDRVCHGTGETVAEQASELSLEAFSGCWKFKCPGEWNTLGWYRCISEIANGGDGSNQLKHNWKIPTTDEEWANFGQIN